MGFLSARGFSCAIATGVWLTSMPRPLALSTLGRRYLLKHGVQGGLGDQPTMPNMHPWQLPPLNAFQDSIRRHP
jgi:hypothetical protein